MSTKPDDFDWVQASMVTQKRIIFGSSDIISQGGDP